MPDIRVIEALGSVTCFDAITPDQVITSTHGKFSFEELKNLLASHGLAVDKVIFDPSRRLLNTFYCEYDRGAYAALQLIDLTAGSSVLSGLANLVKKNNTSLIDKDWDTYYGIAHDIMFGPFAHPDTIPVPMLIYDFSRRLKELPADKIFSIWKRIYKRVSYANGMWTDEVLDYVFQHRPELGSLPVNDTGTLTIYRGVGELSQPPEKALSWSTNRMNALSFCNASARGTGFITAEVSPEDVLAYFPTFYHENEVLVKPGSVRNILYADMIPATQEEFVKLVVPALHDFQVYGCQVKKFGYREEGNHGAKHILRVLMLSLIYYYNSGDELSEADRNILIYFSLLHDCGRTNEDVDRTHGMESVKRIDRQGYRIAQLPMSKRDLLLARLVIMFHSRDDEDGLEAISSEPNFTRKEKERARRLYLIAKDMDGLDRVRFNGLDPDRLRTDFGRRLPLIAGCLLEEDLIACLEQDLTEAITRPIN